MLFRKIADSLRQQDWVTFCVEILVVVVGIYLGLQANVWSQNRNDRRDELDYLERISADLGSSIEVTKASVEFQRRHAGYGKVILDSLRECTLSQEERDIFASGVYLAGKYKTAQFVKASIDELLSSGRTSIIRDAALRQRIIELKTAHEEHLFYMSDVQLRTTPHVNYIDSVTPTIVSDAIGGGTNISWEDLEIDFESLCLAPRFYSAVAATANYTWDSTDALLTWIGEVSSLQRDIDRQLGTLRAAL